jgi:hypothetical protein
MRREQSHIYDIGGRVSLDFDIGRNKYHAMVEKRKKRARYSEQAGIFE